MRPERTLHLHNGDAARAILERSDAGGEHAVWAETLHDGPVRGREPRAVWRAERARFYEALGPAPVAGESAEALLRRWDTSLTRAQDFDEVILWLEHDLFDQLCLIHHLDHFARHPPGDKTLSLVCIGAFPGIDRFVGLGQLDPAELASLLPERHEITGAEIALGQRAWAAFCADDPSGLAALLHDDTSALPFLGAALQRFLEEYPSTRSGVSRTERQVLDRLAKGSCTGAQLFRAGHDREEAPYLGDLPFWWILRRLAGAEHPLVSIAGEAREPMAARMVALTELGVRVQRGDADAVASNGIDLWRGGVHLTGRERIWRWDAATRALVRN